MKLKYKKAFLLILLSTMGIGIVTISLAPQSKKTEGSTKINLSTEDNDTDTADAAQATVTPTITSTPTQVPSPTMASTPSSVPTPTPLPVYALEDEGYPKIEKLIKKYYEAKLNCDIKTIKSIFSDPEDVPSLDQLQEDIMFVEEYQAINCYIKKSFEEGSYIVYAYNDVKYLNINTPAPAVDRFYLITDASGTIKIFPGELDEVTKEYYDARLSDADVQELLTKTNAKGQKAMENDEMLRAFWEALMTTEEDDSVY